jgi:hypothetical protein
MLIVFGLKAPSHVTCKLNLSEEDKVRQIRENTTDASSRGTDSSPSGGHNQNLCV